MNRYQSLITQSLNEDGPWGSMSKVMSELDELLKKTIHQKLKLF